MLTGKVCMNSKSRSISSSVRSLGSFSRTSRTTSLLVVGADETALSRSSSGCLLLATLATLAVSALIPATSTLFDLMALVDDIDDEHEFVCWWWAAGRDGGVVSDVDLTSSWVVTSFGGGWRVDEDVTTSSFVVVVVVIVVVVVVSAVGSASGPEVGSL